MSTYSQHYYPYQEQPVFIDPHAFGYGQYDNRRSKTPTDSLINHTGHSPGPLATPPLASRNLSQQLELPQDQPPEYMQWENDSSSTSPTSVRTPDGSSFEGEMTDFSPTYHHNGNTMSTQSSYHSIPAVDSSMILSDQAVQAAFNATMAEAQQYQQQYAMQTQHSHYTSPLHPQTNMFNQNYTTQPPRHDPWNGQAPSRSSMVPRSGHVVFDPASDHINYSDYLIDVDSWAAQYTDPSSLISPSEPTTSFQGDLYFPQGQNHPHHSYDHVPRTQLPTHQSIEMQLTRASPPPNQQSEKAYANQSTPGEPKLYKTAYGDTAEREFFIPGFLDLEHPVDAMGDTGANRNTMDVSFVRKRGYNIDCKAASIVRVGQGRVKTVGVVHVPFRFRGETTSYLLTFHVLPKCPQDVILGSTFLRLTKTFSNAAKFARRVFDRFVLRTSRHYNMLYLGGGGPTFTGTIGGRPHEALADTGSKVLIMDEDFARSRGLPIVDAEEHRIKLRFADGSTARTSGMTQGVTWQFGLAHEGKSFLLDFYILKDAPSNVILSENFLLRESQAFTEYSDYLLDDYEQEEDEEEGHVFVIRKETSLQYKGQYNGADQLCNDIAWDQEMDLRRNEDYRISVIYDAAARGAAEAAERLRRRQWENVHIITQTVQAEYAGTTSQDPPGASGVQPSGGGGVQPQATAQQNSSGANQTPSRPDALAGSSNTIPPSSRRDKFLKRFGRKRKQIT